MRGARLGVIGFLVACQAADKADSAQSDTQVGLPTSRIRVGALNACLQDGASFSCQNIDVGSVDDGQNVVPDPGDSPWSWMAMGEMTTCYFHDDGTGSCVGWNVSHQAEIPAGPWQQVSIDYEHGCGVYLDGSVHCWGANYAGEVSNVPEGTFAKVIAFGTTSCGLATEGTVTCWGYMSDNPRSPPASLRAPKGRFVDIAGSDLNACALDAAGAVTCWGLEEGDVNVVPSGGGYTNLQMGERHACVQNSDSSLLCWGEGIDGRPPPTGSFANVGLGFRSACGIRDDGAVECWWCTGEPHTCTWGDPTPFGW